MERHYVQEREGAAKSKKAYNLLPPMGGNVQAENRRSPASPARLAVTAHSGCTIHEMADVNRQDVWSASRGCETSAQDTWSRAWMQMGKSVMAARSARSAVSRGTRHSKQVRIPHARPTHSTSPIRPNSELYSLKRTWPTAAQS
jgi:hypothetical protein